MSTAPLEHSTNRTTLGLCSLTGMQSVIRTLPSGRSNSLSSTRVSPRYWRRVAGNGSPWPGGGLAAGAIRQNPWSVSPTRWAKHAAESKRGRQSQSIDPSRPTSAAVWVSPIRP